MDLFLLTYLALWFVVLVLLASQFAVYRYLGQQLRNIPERKQSQGPELGTPLPAALLRTVDGTAVRVGGTRSAPLLLFFASTTCEPCRKALPYLGRFAERHPQIDSVLICRGRTDADVVEFSASLSAVRVVADRGWDFASKLRVSHTPFCMVADASSIVRGKGQPDNDLAFEWFTQQLDIASGHVAPTIELLSPAREHV
jgi:thiol-disulfide isomerase/thioredoxin